jgi:hypothetical protein
MLSRTNQVLALLLALLVAANVVSTPRRAHRDDARALFPALDGAQAARIEIERDEGSLVLIRSQGGWVLPAHGGFPVQEAAVAGLLGALARVVELDAVGRLGDSDGDGGADFGLASGAGADVRISAADGQVLCAFRQGADLDRGAGGRGGLGTYLCPEGSERVYRGGRVPTLSPEPDAWWDPRLVVADPARVEALVLNLEGSATRRIEREGPDRWVWVEGERRTPLPSVLVEECIVASGFLNLVALDAEARASDVGLDPPRAALELELAGNRIAGVRLGEAFGADERWVTRLDWPRPFAARVTEAALRELTGPGGAWARLAAAIDGKEQG